MLMTSGDLNMSRGKLRAAGFEPAPPDLESPALPVELRTYWPWIRDGGAGLSDQSNHPDTARPNRATGSTSRRSAARRPQIRPGRQQISEPNVQLEGFADESAVRAGIA